MTIMAGIYSRSNEKPSPGICKALRSLLSRCEEDEIVERGNDRVWIAKVDIGAFGAAGVHVDADGGFSMLTGEPLMNDRGSDRSSDLKRLHPDWIIGDWRSSTYTRGSFCAACYSAKDQRLRLITDRLGLRALYYIICDQFVLFTTAFRMIEALTCVKKSLDLGALAELATFGLPLGDRTIFSEAKRLLAAEAVVIDPNYVKPLCYWSWDSISPSPNAGLIDRLYEIFMDAISLRLKGDRTALSFLSGGLDSRAIVAGLAQQGITVHTVNFGRPQTQDRALGRQLADALKINHIECDAEEGDWWKSIASSVIALRRATTLADPGPERPGVVWSGEGGSVGFGHVHLSQPIVDLARHGDRSEFAKEFCLLNSWSTGWRRVLRHGWSEILCAEVEQRYWNEMRRAAPGDPGRVPYFFLLFNDQRRKLDALQENADLIRAEMLTPFFDIDFLSCVAGAEIDLLTEHKLYAQWLRLFQPQVYTIPWQAYPGHVPCPLPVPADLEYQWAGERSLTRGGRKLSRRILYKTLGASIPGWLIRPQVTMAAAALTLAGVSNYQYLLECADLFCNWVSKFPPRPLRSGW